MSVPCERVAPESTSRARRFPRITVGNNWFPAELELEYQKFLLNERRSSVRSVNILLAAIFGMVWVWQFWGESLGAHLAQAIPLAVIEISWLLTLWIICSRYFERIYLRTVSIVLFLVAVSGAIEVGWWIHVGKAGWFGVLTAYCIGLYFLFGLRHLAASLANAAMIISLAATLLYLQIPLGEIVKFVLILGATALIGGLVHRQHGVRLRHGFLDRRLIADLATRDGLTGLRNRRAFDEHISRAWRQAAREKSTLALMMIDVDHFKQFNDLYGHQAGDEALKSIASVTKDVAMRPLDMAARFGGEEFIVILFGLAYGRAVQIAESLRAAVEALNIAHAGNEPPRVTVSVGIAVAHPATEQGPEVAVGRADEAMYSAKRDGRNCVRVSKELD